MTRCTKSFAASAKKVTAHLRACDISGSGRLSFVVMRRIWQDDWWGRKDLRLPKIARGGSVELLAALL
jgi:hypothetical protein